MDLALIILILLFGLGLIFVEFFIVPGTTLIGALGGIVVVGAVIYAYSIDETGTTGHITLTASLLVTFVLLWLGFKAYKSRRFALNKQLDGKITLLEEGVINIGDKGVTVNVLRPFGKAVINDEKYEVYSDRGYIDSGVEVEVRKVEGNKIFVRPIK